MEVFTLVFSLVLTAYALRALGMAPRRQVSRRRTGLTRRWQPVP